MNLNRCFEILEISSEATFEEAKASYRLLVQVWHPDKHTHNENLQAKATSKIKEINTAWSEVAAYFKNSSARDTESREAKRRASEERERPQRSEQELPIYIDLQTRLMWVKNGNIRKMMFGKDAINFSDGIKAAKDPLKYAKNYIDADKVGLNWDDAVNWVKSLNYAGFSDWRMPTKEEFESIIKSGGNRLPEWLNANGFTDVAGNYWSSSTKTNKSAGFRLFSKSHITSSAWVVFMYGKEYYIHKDNKCFVWPVRGGV